ncbi:TonB-dependent hemoglobin/transferrin/lactoferrin family receptor [Balneatrix alpica]|uniref:TonB-dependent hemoglobin/transferrin/lactoferrin family receptor n=2 Tax=Balneatrix alpica TaxID=75684 RepID=A0ABV5ZF12_9GAMM
MRLFPLSLLASAMLTTLAAQAAEQLKAVTVTATRNPSSSFHTPAMVDLIDADDAAHTLASSPAELLQGIAGLESGGSARRNSQTFSLRGYEEDGLLILVDGVRQKFEAGHGSGFYLDPQLIQRVEVVRGPHSALYGSGGLGGVIAFSTKDGRDLLAADQEHGGYFSIGGRSDRHEKGSNLALYGQQQQWDYLASLSLKSNESIRLGDGNHLAADDDIASGLFKLGWQVNPDRRLQLSHLAYHAKALEPRNGQSSTASDRSDKTIQSHTSQLSYADQASDNHWLDWQVRLYHNLIDLDESLQSTSSALNQSGDRIQRELQTWGLALDNQSRFEHGSLTQLWSYGLEWSSEEQDGQHSRRNVADGIPDAEARFYSAYLQNELNWDSGWGQWQLIPSLRYDDFHSDNSQGLNQDRNQVSPKLALSWQPQPWLLGFASYAEAFRAPTISETYQTGTHFEIPRMGANRFIPNPNLRPETNRTLEYGFGLDFASVFSAEDQLTFKISRFDTRSEDFIDSKVNMSFFPSCCGTTQAVNVANAKLWGNDAQLNYQNAWLTYRLSYSRINGRDSATGAYLGRLTPTTWVSDLAWKLGDEQQLGWRFKRAKAHLKVNSASEQRAAYDLHDLYYEIRPSQQLRLNASIDNLFDEDYSAAYAGSKGSGRSLNLKATYQW